MIYRWRSASGRLTYLLAVLLCLQGCAKVQNFLKTDKTRLLAPDKLINRGAIGSPINPIYSSVGPADITQELVPNATFPREGDWEYIDTDYMIGPSDVVDIMILDLYQDGLETALPREVSASGFIDLPLLQNRIKAEGFTQEQLRDEVVRAYSPDILRDPTVTVTVAARRQSRFSIQGAVNRPSLYEITRKDMRLLDAIAMAGGITNPSIRYIYIIRPTPAIRRSVGPPEETPREEEILLEELPELPPEAPFEETEEIPTEIPTTDPRAFGA